MLSCGLSLWRSAVAGGGTPPDPILAAFANGEQGAYYDFSDLSSLWQDAAGTTPVTANGQVVGRALDKSPNGNHLTQATGARRPLLEYSGGIGAIVGDGIDKHMRTGAIDLSHTDKVTVIAALNINGGWSKVLAEIGTDYNVNGDIYLSSELGFKANMGGVSGGFRSRDSILYTPALATVIVEVLYDRADITTPTFYVNGVLRNSTLTASGITTGNFVATFPLSLLARWTGSAVSYASTAKYFKSLHIDRLLTADERLVIRQKWATELGIVL